MSLQDVKNLEERGMSVTDQWSAMWQENLQYFFGNQLRGQKRHKNWDWIILNYIWPAAMQEISKLARRDPKIIVEPWDETDSDAADAWQGIAQWMAKNGLNRHGIRIEQIKANLDAKLFGYRVYKVFWENKCYWDEASLAWAGDVKGRLWHPAHFWATDTEDINDGACGSLRYVELEFAKGRWPEYATVFEEEAKDLSEMKPIYGVSHQARGQQGVTGSYPAVGQGPSERDLPQVLNTTILSMIEGARDLRKGELKYVEIHEAYFKDPETDHVKNEEPIPSTELLRMGRIYQNGSEFYSAESRTPMDVGSWPLRVVSEYDRPKYPNGRWVMWCGDTQINPGNEVYPYTRWPYIVAPHYLLPHMWQGLDGVQMYKTTQDGINTTVSHLVNNMKLFGDPKVAIEAGAIEAPKGRDQDHYIAKGAGRVIRLLRGGLKKFKIIDPVSPSSSHSQLYGLFSQEFKNQVGLQDISQGKASNTTATEASYLVQSANDRILLQSVYEEKFLREIMSLAIEIAQKRYEPERWVRILGPDDAAGITQITEGLKTARFDIMIEVGSTLPFDDERRIAKYKEAFAVLGQPVANPMTPEMLEALEIPNRKRLLEKYEAYQVYAQYMGIFDGVRSGEVDPVSAMKQLIQIAETAIAPYAQQAIKEETAKGAGAQTANDANSQAA